MERNLPLASRSFTMSCAVPATPGTMARPNRISPFSFTSNLSEERLTSGTRTVMPICRASIIRSRIGFFFLAVFLAWFIADARNSAG